MALERPIVTRLFCEKAGDMELRCPNYLSKCTVALDLLRHGQMGSLLCKALLDMGVTH